MLKQAYPLIVALILANLISISVAMRNTTEYSQYIIKLPDNVPTCPEDDNINECIQDALNFIIRSTRNGFPELNIRPIDPLMVSKLNVHFSNNLIRGKASVRNVTVTGLSQSAVRKIHYQRNAKDIKVHLHYQGPIIQIAGQYKADVTLNNAKFLARGQFNISMIDFDAKSEHIGVLYERDGHLFLKWTKIHVEPTLGDMKIYATGLVPEPALNNALLEIINSNWRILYRSVVTSTQSTWEPIIKNYYNEFLSHLPFDALITNLKLIT
ncbi:uncharacterized protein LOC142223806 isoform X2 [Haematobia irritans]|uniref:uncharacterized protein LOC142223806 isoform X2 n=1 Tax=Haematobia irritans TaxID=7368 RepID=UPI003F4F5FB9